VKYFKDAFKNAPSGEERNAIIKAQLNAAEAEQAFRDALNEMNKRSEKIKCPNTKCSGGHLTLAYITKNEGKAIIQECIGLFCVKCKSFYLL
jgi:hypothetical protein